MTALTKYERLEATGLWRASPDEQRIEVIVSLGDATLTIKNQLDQAITHWSLAAIERANPGKRPAIFHPQGDPSETLEIPANEDELIRAIEKLRHAVERARPQSGRLRGLLSVAMTAGLALVGYIFLPPVLIDQAVRVVPDVKRAEIGNDMLTAMQRVTGAPCTNRASVPALTALTQRLTEADHPTYLAVMRSGVTDAVHIPGGVILLSRTLVEDYDSPDVVAGYIIAEQERRQSRDPLRDLLENAGMFSTVRLLTTGRLPASAIEAQAHRLLTQIPPAIDIDSVLMRFDVQRISSSPFGYAIDLSGERTLPLIEGDPHLRNGSAPVLTDAQWVRLQAICEG